MAAVKLELAQREAVEGAQGQLPLHEVTPAAFLQVGFELEEQQCVLLGMFGTIICTDIDGTDAAFDCVPPQAPA